MPGRISGAALFALALGGCSLPEQRADFRSVDPQERTLALAQAARERDQDSIPVLISMLDSEDAGERMLAIQTLERLTGQTLGYDFAAPRFKREPAVREWVQWDRARRDAASG